MLISLEHYLDDLDDEHKREGEGEDDENQGEHGQGHGAHTRTLLATWASFCSGFGIILLDKFLLEFGFEGGGYLKNFGH